MVDVQEDRGLYLAQFERFENIQRAGNGVADWLLPIRKAAIARFTELGFPSTKDEEWRFTDVTRIAERMFERPDDSEDLLTPEDIAPYLEIVGDAVATLVLVNGLFRRELSSLDALPDDLEVLSMADAWTTRIDAVQPHLTRYAGYAANGFLALNAALMEDGAFVHVGRGCVVQRPVHVLHITIPGAAPTAVHPHSLFVGGQSSQVTIIEQFVTLGDGEAFTNAVTEIVAEQGAVIDHYCVQLESAQTYHIATRQIHQRRDSNVSSHVVTLGGCLVRNDINTVLDGEGVDCYLKGLYVVDGSRHVDNHLSVDHAKPHCNSREFFKGILDDRGRGVFSGRIIVRKDAQKTDAKQTNRSLLLSKDAQVESKPQLNILADDVKCTHGATIGQIDENALFYLRSRGIPANAAHSLLVLAFARESIDEIKVETLRRALDDMLVSRLPHGALLREEA